MTTYLAFAFLSLNMLSSVHFSFKYLDDIEDV